MADGERIRVLIADDHQELLERVAAILASEFTVVGAVTDGAQLVAAQATLNPDVMIVDLCMPRMNGLEAATRIRRGGSEAPIVILTAYSEPEGVEAAVAAGALGYVTKESLAHDLLPAIRAALAGRPFVSAGVWAPHSHTT
jgi:DNA-binding NarL/FixJ family response regulator